MAAAEEAVDGRRQKRRQGTGMAAAEEAGTMGAKEAGVAAANEEAGAA